MPRNPRYFKGKITDVPKRFEAMLTNRLYYISEFTKTRFAERKYCDALEQNPAPPECATCYKLYGA